ncbi:MAG: ATP-grasp domain-containing protein [Sulfitobacter sp.]|uniref:ATP-grasp domain-containing protein n=1 Tax=Roseibium sp. TaxID=1936156 RepID=UPI0032639C29
MSAEKSCKSIAFIESNTTGTGAELIYRATSLGSVQVLARNPERYPFLADVDVTITTADTTDINAILAGLEDIPSVCAVCTTSDPFTAITAQVARMLRLPGTDPDACARCLDKLCQVERLANFGLRVPRTLAANEVAALNDLSCDMAWILKPVTGSGSVGVRYLPDLFEVRLALREADRKPTLLLQEFIPGPEYSIELCGNGRDLTVLGVVAKRVSELPVRVETGHMVPAPIAQGVADELQACAVRAARALGLEYGFFHVEVILTPKGPVVVEVNPRMAGGGIPFLLSAVTGRDLLTDWLMLALGEQVLSDCGQVLADAGAIAFRLADRDGRLTSITPPDVKPKSIWRADRLRKQGEIVVRNGDFRDRVLSAISLASQADTALALADQYLANFDLEFVDAAEPVI